MVLMTNVCESCGDGRFTVTHHEAAHRCPVCELVARLEEADAAILEAESLRDTIEDLEETIEKLEAEHDNNHTDRS